MGWSLTAPTLPSGSTWVQKGTTSWENNNIVITSKVSVARLDDDGIAIRITETRTQQGSAYSKDNYMRVDIGGTTGTPYTTDWAANSGVEASVYYTGTAAAGVTIKVVVGFRADTSDSLKTVTFTAPDLLGPTLYINVSGTARKVVKILINVNGTAKTVNRKNTSVATTNVSATERMRMNMWKPGRSCFGGSSSPMRLLTVTP